MTPLAHRIVKELTLPPKKRVFVDRCELLDHMSDIHCFEVTEAFEMATSLARDMVIKGGIADESGFLPAPKTWIEWQWRKPHGARMGILLIEPPPEQGSEPCAALWARDYPNDFSSYETIGRFSLKPSSWSDVRYRVEGFSGETGYASGFVAQLYALLAIINTPRVIGRRQHMPHRGLERRLLTQRAAIGVFPLNAWTEIKLEVNKTADMSDDVIREAHLTGERARHFVRAHLRIRLGRLEFVSAHWRGNEALGVKHSRYTLVAKNGMREASQ